ncbi:MAG: iron-sulfur cluster assembly scaffold protein [Alphaproteobacteria bacterium]|nr:iron-sulfur cluster assembly scaffold protein [Alphaproteobacteria bacterium]MDE2113083.1 iron-sulfur cluster assembly scaffold protein [Alphaproteobacteria bacterium]MDE2492868.1 iron-sulfur cluster assembly scaffold protein [Alphaproteobacteria bacterium]
MSDPLYTKDILRLAAEATGAGRLPAPHGSYSAHNPACGDRSTIDLRIADGRIASMAHDTKACILAQASASILGATLPGHSYGDLVKLKAEVSDMFQTGRQPSAPFSPYLVLREAGQYANRRKCVLLPIDAALKAFEASEMREPGGQGT